MVSKTLFIVLLGVAFVLSTPVPEEATVGKSEVAVQESNVQRGSTAIVEYDEAQLRAFEEHWDSLKRKVKKTVEKWENKWEGIKGKSVETYYKLVDKATEILVNTEKLIKEAKQAYKTLRESGTVVYKDLKSMYQILVQAYKDIKEVAGEAYDDFKDILKELGTALQEHDLVLKSKQVIG